MLLYNKNCIFVVDIFINGCMIDISPEWFGGRTNPMRTKLALIAISVFTVTSVVADIGSAEKVPMATITTRTQTVISTTSQEGRAEMPWWFGLAIFGFIYRFVWTESGRYMAEND